MPVNDRNVHGRVHRSWPLLLIFKVIRTHFLSKPPCSEHFEVLFPNFSLENSKKWKSYEVLKLRVIFLLKNAQKPLSILINKYMYWYPYLFLLLFSSREPFKLGLLQVWNLYGIQICSNQGLNSVSYVTRFLSHFLQKFL